MSRHSRSLALTAVTAVSAALMLSACSSPTSTDNTAAEFPEKTVKIIVPFSAGGSLDANSRILADCLSQEGGQWVVENQTGGGGTIGVNNLVSAKPDGYTLAYVSSSGVALTPLQSDGAKYTSEDLKPISIVTKAPAALLVRAESPYATAEDFFAAAKEGEELTIATTGALGLYQLIVQELQKSVAVTPVPFDGTAPAVTAALGGNTDAVIAEVSGTTLDQIESGQFRVLATGADEPVEFIPEVPTLSSLGFELPESSNYGLLVAATDVPEDVVEAISGRVNTCASNEDVQEKIGAEFIIDPALTGDEAQEVITTASDQYKAAVEGSE